jgi:hypothetical protein
MAFGIDATSHPTAVNGSPPWSWSHTCAADATHAIAFIGNGASVLDDRTVDSCTYGGASCTGETAQDDGIWVRAQIWVKESPVADGANDFSATSTSSGAQFAGTGVSFLDAIKVSSGGTVLTNQTNPGITGIATQPGDIVVGMIFTDDAVNAITADGTLLFEDEDISTDTDFSCQYVVASGTSTNLTWTQTSAGGGGAAIAYVVMRSAVPPVPTYNVSRDWLEDVVEQRGMSNSGLRDAKVWF